MWRLCPRRLRRIGMRISCGRESTGSGRVCAIAKVGSMARAQRAIPIEGFRRARFTSPFLLKTMCTQIEYGFNISIVKNAGYAEGVLRPCLALKERNCLAARGVQALRLYLRGLSAEADSASAELFGAATHRQASGCAGLLVLIHTQDKGAVRRRGKVRMIWVMISSFRHTRILRAGEGARIVPQFAPRVRLAGLGYQEGWVEPPVMLEFQVVSAHSLEQGCALRVASGRFEWLIASRAVTAQENTPVAESPSRRIQRHGVEGSWRFERSFGFHSCIAMPPLTRKALPRFLYHTPMGYSQYKFCSKGNGR